MTSAQGLPFELYVVKELKRQLLGQARPLVLSWNRDYMETLGYLRRQHCNDEINDMAII